MEAFPEESLNASFQEFMSRMFPEHNEDDWLTGYMYIAYRQGVIYGIKHTP